MKALKTIITDKNLLYVLCALVFAVLLTVSIIHPQYLLGNKFLMSFLRNELLNVLAVTTSVNMAVSAHLVTLLSNLEDAVQEIEFPRLRRSLARNIVLLGIYFISSIGLLAVESGISGNAELRA